MVEVNILSPPHKISLLPRASNLKNLPRGFYFTHFVHGKKNNFEKKIKP
jgi:hypothetical protein